MATKQLPVNQILIPRIIRPNLTFRPPSTQFVGNQVVNYKILNMRVAPTVDARSPGQRIIYPIVSTVSPQVPLNKISQPSVSALSPQQLQAVLQCVQQQKQQQRTDQILGKKDIKNPSVIVRNPTVMNPRPCLVSKELTDEVSKIILKYKTITAYREMLLCKNIIYFYKCMSHDCSFSSPSMMNFVNHLKKHKAEDDKNGE